MWAEADDSLHHNAKADEDVARKEEVERPVVTQRCNDVPMIVAPARHRVRKNARVIVHACARDDRRLAWAEAIPPPY